MYIMIDQATIHLDRNEVLEVGNGEAHEIACCEGSVWITCEGDSEDIIVKAGECFVSDSHGKTVVGALEGSAISIR